jgi:putative Holliday junction resolvase
MGPGGRLLGVDVGERRIGVAVSEGTIAVPLTIIEHTNRAEDLARLVEIAKREQVEAIVVGLPVSLSGEEHEQARLTRRFGDQLAAAVDVPMIYHDERYSSVQAAAATDDIPSDKRGRRSRTVRRRPLDDRAAAIILQSYIDHAEREA